MNDPNCQTNCLSLENNLIGHNNAYNDNLNL